MRGAGILMVFALAAGCGGDKSSGGDATGANDTSVGDTSNGDATAVGDSATNADGDATTSTSFCSATAPCTGADEVCDCHGQCVVATGKTCTEDRNCGVPHWCNECTGHCEDQVAVCAPCEESRGCLDQGACLPYASGGSFCGLGCVTAAGCPDGFDCLAVEGFSAKQCIAKSGTCEDLGLCNNDSACPIGQVCSDATHQCAPGCTEDGECHDGTVCVAARCVAPCGGDGDCTAPATCQGGKCKVPGACEAAADCPTPATYCSRDSGKCETGCLIDDDCKDAGKICKANACVDKGCLHNFECAFGRVCDHASGQCVPFPASEPHCATCDASVESNPGCPAPDACIQFQDDQGAKLGDYCIVPCKDDPIDRCPSGWQCQDVPDPDSGADQYFCVRPCYLNPVGTTP